jgi:hypothetical protein
MTRDFSGMRVGDVLDLVMSEAGLGATYRYEPSVRPRYGRKWMTRRARLWKWRNPIRMQPNLYVYLRLVDRAVLTPDVP